MKSLFRLLSFLCVVATIPVAAQTTVSGTVSDTNGIVWGGSKVTATVVVDQTAITSAGYANPYSILQAASLQRPVIAVANASGAYSLTLPYFSSTGISWTFQACPSFSSQLVNCRAIAPVVVSSATQTVNVVVSPLSLVTPMSAYDDSEIANPTVGQIYYNTISTTNRQYTSSLVWAPIAGGGGGATLPSSGLVVATSPTTSRAATQSDITSLISGLYDPIGTGNNASNLTSGTIPAARVPTLNQNTTGTAANLSGTPALPSGTTATTQTAGDTSTALATDGFSTAAVGVEATRAQGAETTLTNNLSTESGTARTNETTLQSNLNTFAAIYTIGAARTATGTTDTIASTDLGTATPGLITYTNTGTVAVTLPTGGLTAKSYANVYAQGGTVVLTPSSGTINGLSSLTLTNGQSGTVSWTGAAYLFTTGLASGATGAAGGDLSGSYPNPQVAKVKGAAVPVVADNPDCSNTSGQLISCTPGYDYESQNQNYYFSSSHQSGYQLLQGAVSPNAPVYTNTPDFELINGDSKLGYYALNYLLYRDSITPLNSLGGTNFANFSLYQSAAPVTYSGPACTVSRNDTTSPQSWGVSGYITVCPVGAVITLSVSNRWVFDAEQTTYRQYTGGGTFTQAVNGTTIATVNTAGSESLGVSTVTTGIGRSNAGEVVTWTVSVAPVTFYTFGMWQKAQSGPSIFLFTTGGSQLHQWAAQPTYLAQFVASLPFTRIANDLNTNDAAAAFSTTQYMADVATLDAALVPNTVTSPPDLVWFTAWDLGTSISPCQVNATETAQLESYRQALYANQSNSAYSAYGYGIEDLRAALPTFAEACARGIMSDATHPGGLGVNLFARKAVLAEQFSARDPQNARTSLQKSFLGYGVYPPASGTTAGFAILQYPSSGAVADSGTGMYANGDIGHLEFDIAGYTYDKFGALLTGSGYEAGMNNGSTFAAGKLIHTWRPDVNLPCNFHSYGYAPVHGTLSTAYGFALCGNSTDATFNWDFGAGGTELHFSYLQNDWLGFRHSSKTLDLSSDALFGFSSSAAGSTAGTGSRAALDTSITRSAAGVLSFNTSTAGNGLAIIKEAAFLPGILYSAAGTPLPACSAATKGQQAVVSDATSPTYMGAYTSGGAITAAVICSYNGTTYANLTH